MLQGKKILFIAPVFHGYESMILEKLEGFGAEVTFVPEREYTLRYKILNNLNPSYIDALQVRYYEKLLMKINGMKFDYLFIIRGYKMPASFVDEFKTLNPQARLLMYQWDSNRTNPFAHHIERFDRVLSFDYKDCDEFNLQYLPLFYTDDVTEYFGRENEYDFFFMGTYLPNRYRALSNFMHEYKDKYKIRAYIYIPFTSLIKEIIKGNLCSMKYLSVRHMSREEYLSILSSSKAMVDVSNASQSGLAMRIIEALTLGKKVVTNNLNIYNEPFFCDENILVYDDKHPDIPQAFLDVAFKGNGGVLSIEDWLIKLFE